MSGGVIDRWDEHILEKDWPSTSLYPLDECFAEHVHGHGAIDWHDLAANRVIGRIDRHGEP